VSELKLALPVYTVYDERLEQNGAVIGFTGEFVNHTSGEGQGCVLAMDAVRREGEYAPAGTKASRSIVRAWWCC